MSSLSQVFSRLFSFALSHSRFISSLSLSFIVLACFSVTASSVYAATPKPTLSKPRVTLVPSASLAGIRTIQATMVVEAPPALVWDVMTQYDDLDEFIPGYQKSRLLQSNGATKLVSIAMKPAPLLPTFRYTTRVIENEKAYTLAFERIQGDFKVFKANYKLTAKDNGRQTLITYSLAIDPGNAMPGTNNILKSNTEKTFTALQVHVEDIYHKRMIGQR